MQGFHALQEVLTQLFGGSEEAGYPHPHGYHHPAVNNPPHFHLYIGSASHVRHQCWIVRH